MPGLDVEALLESTAAKAKAENKDGRLSVDPDDRHKSERSDRRDRDRARESSRDRDRDRKRRDRSRDRKREDGVDETKSPCPDSKSSKRRSRSRDSGRHARRRRDSPDTYRGDFYRGRTHTRSRSPDGDRYYRPTGRRDEDRDRHRDRERRGGREGGRRRTPSPHKPSKSKTPELNDDERDRRTVFVQQLAARLRTKELISFFEKVGPVKEAQIVKDRVSGRSKGVGYVEFKNEESVPAAIQLTGQKLLGIPIIAQHTEAEKNRQARTTEGTAPASGVPFHRLYVGNIHFSITEQDLQDVFEPFGELEFVQLQKEEQGRSRGYGFVQFRDPTAAKEALEKMNGYDIAGRPIRVGLGNDKFTSESTANLLQRFPGPSQQFQGSAFSGAGGRGAHAGGGTNFDRIGARDNEKGAGSASALDDSDVAGVNFNNFSRDALMRKLARTEEPAPVKDDKRAKPVPKAPLPAIPQASRCVVLHNMFDAAEEEANADGGDWIKDLEVDVKSECERKYGHVVHIKLDPNSQGDIYVKFDRIEGGENAIKGLNGRFFGGRVITANPVVDAVYSTMFRERAG
ncbi:splicing factor, CC1-like protein [Trichodelitschia bisporula]|uniref:Splicing factor, CC1-like protein n=1 Tax=Trichodelitschia bisporula TaxID=703511 RepID=A0A6G1HKG3_9PEZI|nr:splicing factor, CC1-like protein [Trichodelitschia bisporula]